MSPTLAIPGKKRPPPATLQSAHIPAPVGGLNTVDPASELPDFDCLRLYNLTAAELGLRVRLGYAEWCTGLTGATLNGVRTTMPFTGSHKSGATDKLFGCTQAGIWDCTASSATPTQLVTFGTQTGDAGIGVFTTMSTPAGRFLVYCDEENGTYVWSESGAAWTQVGSTATQLWASSTAYLVGNQVVHGDNVYIVTVGGTSDSSGGPTTTGTGITDGTVTWDFVVAKSTTSIGPSLADQQAGFTGLPTNFAAVCAWKSRLFFVEKDSSRAWYLSINSVYGTATSVDFGGKMRAGGPLANLYNWSYDAGNGLDTLLVGLSTSGDVVIYQGTDPNSASTFSIKGSWTVGGVPSGRRIATDYGGDIVVASVTGLVPLSRLVVGQPVVAGDRSVYATEKISNQFNVDASAYRTNSGWAIGLHPGDNALVVLVPTVNDTAATPYVMSLSKKSWSLYRDLPILSMGVWNGVMYFGTPDGRVCKASGYVDGVTLADPTSYSPVEGSLVTAYRNGGSQRQKLIKQVRPCFETQQPTLDVSVVARFNYDLTEAPPPTGSTTNADGTWDHSTWDSTTWGGDYQAYSPLLGATGMGREVALAIRFKAASRTSFIGVDVFWEEGSAL